MTIEHKTTAELRELYEYTSNNEHQLCLDTTSQFIYLKHKCVGSDWSIFCEKRQLLWSLHLGKVSQGAKFNDEDKDRVADSLQEFFAV